LPWHKRPVSFFQLDPPTFTRERNDFLGPPFFAGVRRISSRKAAPEQEVRLFCGWAHVSWPLPPQTDQRSREGELHREGAGGEEPKMAPRFFPRWLSGPFPHPVQSNVQEAPYSVLCSPFLCSIFSSYMLSIYMLLWYDREGMGTMQQVLEAGLIREGAFWHASSSNDCVT